MLLVSNGCYSWFLVLHDKILTQWSPWQNFNSLSTKHFIHKETLFKSSSLFWRSYSNSNLRQSEIHGTEPNGGLFMPFYQQYIWTAWDCLNKYLAPAVCHWAQTSLPAPFTRRTPRCFLLRPPCSSCLVVDTWSSWPFWTSRLIYVFSLNCLSCALKCTAGAPGLIHLPNFVIAPQKLAYMHILPQNTTILCNF